MASTSSPAWVLTSQSSFDSLQLIDNHPTPQLGEHDILVELHAASLNYRDIVLAKGTIPLPFFRPGVIPGSDGAGVVEKVGSSVKDFQPGDRVCTHLAPHLPPSKPASMADICHGLGQELDGTLQTHGVFHEAALVHMPEGLDYLEASTLTCSGLTAWNALFGVEEYRPKDKDYVLVQGTGGVSIAALQFALAAGATVIATTSTEAKAERLRALGAHHVINYREDADWGATAKGITENGEGVHIVVDVGGSSTISQSLKAIRNGGLISLAGMLGKEEEGIPVPKMMDCLWNVCAARGFLLGTRDQFREMNQFITKQGIKPVVDERVFEFEEAKQAYEILEKQQHFSKVCIRIR
ncbi:alcohol dehydrogenase [Penicillium longicatenatum]|nr:alcohol dehydrogenase [Penicillium longicatenatum]